MMSREGVRRCISLMTDRALSLSGIPAIYELREFVEVGGLIISGPPDRCISSNRRAYRPRTKLLAIADEVIE
jgi:hypothetical protein